MRERFNGPFLYQESPEFPENVFEEDPEKRIRNIVWIHEESGQKFALFHCPCGCEQAVNIPISGPKGWSLENIDGKAHLNPSVLRISGCKSHFFIRNGMVEWC